MKNCAHSLRNTTSDNFMQCEKCKAVFRSKHGTALEMVKAKPVAHLTWSASEREMLNQSHKPEYADLQKAEKDLKNYWS